MRRTIIKTRAVTVPLNCRRVRSSQGGKNKGAGPEYAGGAWLANWANAKGPMTSNDNLRHRFLQGRSSQAKSSVFAIRARGRLAWFYLGHHIIQLISGLMELRLFTTTATLNTSI